MRKVLLLHQGFVQHYRVSVYNYLAKYLLPHNYELTVASSAIENNCPHKVLFNFHAAELSLGRLLRYIIENKPDAVIFFVNLKNPYLFPLMFLCKIKKIKIIYWGHGRDQSDKHSKFKNSLYWLEHTLSDSIVLYASHLRHYISDKNREKIFIANNTLNLTAHEYSVIDKAQILNSFGICTKRNILFVGRLQKRKKLDTLLRAHSLIGKNDVGLVIVGPVEDADISVNGYKNVYKLGPIYGDSLFELMGAMDVYCMPGWVGLSIVDAFFMGLPLVTQEGDHPPEISYLINEENGYLLPKGDVALMASVLENILFDDALRERMSQAARRMYRDNAHIDRMCEGFHMALNHAFTN